MPSSVPALVILGTHKDSVPIAARQLRPRAMGVVTQSVLLEETVTRCMEVRREQEVEFRYRLVHSPQDIADIFEVVKASILELEDMGYGRQDIFLEPTGGTTVMRIGAALAATTLNVGMIIRDVPYLYVNGEWKRDESEEIKLVPVNNPLEATGLLRDKQAVELFNRRDYMAAALVLEDIAQKVTGVERSQYYRGLLKLAKGYGAWDVANYSAALSQLGRAREDLNVKFADRTLSERVVPLLDRLNVNLPFLNRVNEKKLYLEKVVDMVENARRRILDQGRFDDGVARLYRAIEMWHQWRLLKNYSVDTSQVKWDELGKDMQKRFLQVTGMDFLPEALWVKLLPRQIGLDQARKLDHMLSGEDLDDDPNFKNLLRERNQSILAHGLRPISEKAASGFLDRIDQVIAVQETVRIGAEHASLREI